jgi:hypothetical protein
MTSLNTALIPNTGVISVIGTDMDRWENAGTFDINNPKNEDLEPWFGIPRNPAALTGDDAFVTRHQLPYAYKGKNNVLATNIEGLVLNDTEEILSEEYGVPRRLTDSLSFSVSTLIFDEGLLDVEPEEGVARHMRFSQRTAQGTMIRKSKGMHFEHGFLYTAPGRALYYQQQKQMALTIVHDMIFNTLISLRDSRLQSIETEARLGYFNFDFREMVKKKNHRFGMFQKYYDGPVKLVKDVSAKLELRGAKANVCISSRGLEYFWQGTGDENRLYSKAGPAGPARVNADPNSVTRVGPLKLIFTRLFQDKNHGQYPVDPLIRTRMNGEYYVMAPPPLEVIDENYMTSNRNIKVIDLQKNNWGTIRLEDALNSTPMFGGDNISLVEPGDKYGKRGSMFMQSSGSRDETGGVLTELFGMLPEHVIPKKVFNFMVAQLHNKLIREGEKPNIHRLAKTFAGVSSIGAVELMKNAEGIARASEELLRKFREDSNDVGLEGIGGVTGGTSLKVTGKRGRQNDDAGFTPESYCFVTPKSSTGLKASVNEPASSESLHEQNLKLLQNVPGNVTPLYLGLYETRQNVTNVDAFQTRVNSVLKSQNQDDVNTLVAHMEKAISTEYTPKKQQLSVQYLNSYPEKSSTDVHTTPVAMQESTTPESYMVSTDFYNANKSRFNTDNAVYGAYNLDDLLEAHERLDVDSSNKSGLNIGEFKDKHLAFLKLSKYDPKRSSADALYTFLFTCKINRVFFEFLLTHDIYYPFTHLIFRPWMTFVTSSVIIMQGGQETAVNYYMKPDVMLSDNETTKTHSAHMTVHLSPFVKKANNIQVVDDVAIRRYVAGGTVKGYSPDDLMELASAQNWVPGSHPERPSWFSVMIPMTLNNLDSIIDFRGYFTGEEGNEEKMHFVSCALTIDSHFGVHPENYHPESPGTQWTAEDPNYNSVCAQGTQLCYNYAKKDFTAVIIGHDAPLGPNVYTGMRTVMEGLETLFVDQQYYDVSKYKVYECYQ